MNIDAQLVAIALDKPLEEGKKKKKKPYDSVTYTTGDIQKNIDHFNKMLGGKAENSHTDGYLNGTFKGPDGASCVSDAGGSAGGDGGGIGESLAINEAKRYVRRYYIKPQNLFCSNKDEVLKALIDHEDEDCTVYTLNNLDDNNKDVNKLNSNDIIYYYEDGILYDKNHVRIMDYELSIKHEEERPHINPDQVSDAKLADVYQDRMTGVTDLGESIALEEDKIFVGKIGQELDLPPEIHLLDKNGVENFIDTLEPEEEFEVGYVNPQYFYKELWDYLPIYKCTEMTGYTGVDFEGSEDDEYDDKQARIDRANKEIADAKADGQTKQVGSDVQYSMQNKLVHRYNRVIPGQSGTHNTILFYPVGAPKVCYFVKLPGKTDFLKVTTEQLEKYIYAALPAIENKLRVDVTKAKTNIYNTLYGQSVQSIDRETADGKEIDSKYIYKYQKKKRAVRSLYTSQIYYLKGRGLAVGKTLVEALNNEEAFNLTFDNINVYGEKLTEGKEHHKCCICGEEIEGYGNNAEPYKEGQCCDACNLKFVIPARLDQINAKEEK